MTAKEHLSNPQTLASLIDHTLLKPEATEADLGKLCGEALENGFATVCVNPYWVRFAKRALAGSQVRVCTVIGFPLGANRTASKLAEARLALTEGAAELDMVQNVGALRSGDSRLVQEEIAALAALAHLQGAILKVILEMCLLNEEQKTTAARLAAEANADFVKTSTGFSSGGATEADVRLLRGVVAPSLGVKASGGIRSLAALRRMVEAGANRIGTSSGVLIMREFREGPASAPLTLAAAKVPGGHPDAY